jgi:hypothetical protein
MPSIPIRHAPSSPDEGPDPRELYERLERVRRRLAALARAEQATDHQLRRQRAAGRRP